MADINVLDLTPTTPGSNDSLILFDRTTGEGKSTRFDTLSGQVLDSKFGDSNPTAGQELSYNPTTGKYENTSQIASLNKALTTLLNKRIIIISDSYGSYDDGNSNTFIDLIGDYLGFSSDELYGFYLGGSGFTKTGDKKWLNLLIANESSVSDPDTISDIYCIGGANDIGASESAISTAIDEFITHVKGVFPKALVHTAFPGIIISNDYSTRDIAIKGYKDVVEFGGSYVNNSEYILKNFDLIRTQDNVHPNNQGVIELAKQFANAITTGVCDVTYKNSPTIYTLITGATITSKMYMNRKNGVLEVGGTSGNLYFSMSVSGSTAINNNTALVKITKSMWFGNSSKSAVVDVFIDNNFTAPIPAIIYVSDINTDGTVNIKIYFYDAGGRSINSSIAIYGRNTFVD